MEFERGELFGEYNSNTKVVHDPNDPIVRRTVDDFINNMSNIDEDEGYEYEDDDDIPVDNNVEVNTDTSYDEEPEITDDVVEESEEISEEFVEDSYEPNNYIEEEPEIESVEESTDEVEEIEENIEETKVIKTSDGEISIYTEDDVIDDTEESITYQGIVNYRKTDDYITKSGIVFGNSKLKIEPKKIDLAFVNPLDLLKEFKANGHYIDVYLPVSNIGVRVYEFDEVVYYESVFNAIRTYAGDYLNRVLDEKIPITKRLLSLIKSNCVFLCADGSDHNELESFEKLSATDIELLLLGVASMVTFVHNKKKDYVYKIEGHICENSTCRANLNSDIDLKALFKSQYTKLAQFIPDIQQRIDNYNVNETFAEKLKNSIHNKTKLFKISKRVNGIEQNVSVAVKDPTYGANKILLDSLYDFLLRKYDSKLKFITQEIPNYHLLANNKKLAYILEYMRENGMGDDITMDFISDYVDMRMVPYIPFIKFDYKKSTGVESHKSAFEDLSLEHRIKTIKELSPKLKEYISNYIEELENAAIKTIEMDIVCSKCGHKHTLALEPVLFFFMIAETMHRQRTV